MTTTTTTTIFLSVATAPQFPQPEQHHFYGLNYKRPIGEVSLTKSPFKPIPHLRSTPPSSVSVVEEEEQNQIPSADLSPLSGCKACGRGEIEKGCNGEGRIQGGIATVPGFGWWPIKAYRPCPGFLESGGRYRRRGQSMDEVAFGRGGDNGGASSMATADEAQSRKKKQGPGKLKS